MTNPAGAEATSMATFEPTTIRGGAVAAEARAFVARELWAAGLLDTSEPVLDLIDEVGDLVDEAIACSYGPTHARAEMDATAGGVELTVDATTASARADAFDPDLLDPSLIEVLDRRSDLPRIVDRVTVRMRSTPPGSHP